MKKSWDGTKTGFERFGNGTKLFYCHLVTCDSYTAANVPKWYCSIFKRIRPDSCTCILEKERNVQQEEEQKDLEENEVDANKKKRDL
ncbi:MAG: hypothetical protein LBK92_02275 [Endomicrobium sp.]|nr:hypothetical protein [Endomicrobium sp.]